MISKLGASFRVLAIETSCDDTAVAIVSSCRRVLSNVIIQQHQEHSPYKGIVPRLAAQLHRQNLPLAIQRCIQEAGLDGIVGSIDAVAATRGPGLGASLTAGFQAGRCIAAASGLPFYGIHHMEGHALTARLDNPSIRFPFLSLLISGGHTLLLVVRGLGDYTILGRTLDDSVGEALDKATGLLELPWIPGESPAASIEQAAGLKRADSEVEPLPIPMKGDPSLDFSFAGLKTALKYRLARLGSISQEQKHGLAYEFQRIATIHLEERLSKAMQLVAPEGITQVIISGGVAKNQFIRSQLTVMIREAGMEPPFAPLQFCSDNAVMIGWAAVESILEGVQPIDLGASVDVLPDWPLDELKLMH